MKTRLHYVLQQVAEPEDNLSRRPDARLVDESNLTVYSSTRDGPRKPSTASSYAHRICTRLAICSKIGAMPAPVFADARNSRGRLSGLGGRLAFLRRRGGGVNR